MNEEIIRNFERMLGIPAGKGLPPALVAEYDRAKIAADRIQTKLHLPDLVVIALIAGVLPSAKVPEKKAS